MFPGIKVNYAPLTGLELLDYNNPARRGISPSEYKDYKLSTATGTSEYQPLISSLVEEIHGEVVGFKRSNNVITPWTSHFIHKYAHHRYTHQ